MRCRTATSSSLVGRARGPHTRGWLLLDDLVELCADQPGLTVAAFPPDRTSVFAWCFRRSSGPWSARRSASMEHLDGKLPRERSRQGTWWHETQGFLGRFSSPTHPTGAAGGEHIPTHSPLNRSNDAIDERRSGTRIGRAHEGRVARLGRPRARRLPGSAPRPRSPASRHRAQSCIATEAASPYGTRPLKSVRTFQKFTRNDTACLTDETPGSPMAAALGCDPALRTAGVGPSEPRRCGDLLTPSCGRRGGRRRAGAVRQRVAGCQPIGSAKRSRRGGPRGAHRR